MRLRYKHWMKAVTKDRENTIFLIWLFGMACYYGYRLFALTPWYDELYTYYYFISKGPVYAAIHWPLPNNHVGYSVLSGILNWFGSSAVGLRGVAYISSLYSFVLLYLIGKKIFKNGWSLVCVVLYASMHLVNQLAVQGRGYSLAAACFLTALYQLFPLWEGNGKKRNYLLFGTALTLSLYTVPSSVYWVLPLCLTGGISLLLNSRKKETIKLIVCSFCAAVATVFLYGLIWLAIGSNLLSKLEGGTFFGKGHVQIILNAPFLSLKTGIEYMLATPYIQSVGRQEFLEQFTGWLEGLLQMFVPNGGFVLTVVLIAGTVCIAGTAMIRYAVKKTIPSLTELLLVIFMLVTPLLLVIQSTMPYFRVFSYMGVIFALIIVTLCQFLFKRWAIGKKTNLILCSILCLSSFFVLGSSSYSQQYGMEEYYVKDAFSRIEAPEDKNLCVTDCYQQYILKYYWDIDCENTQIEGADYVLLCKDMTDKDFEVYRWELFYSYDTIDWSYVEENLSPVYENERYLLYKSAAVNAQK